MANRRLTLGEQATLAQPLLSHIRGELLRLADGDSDLHWALRRKLYKELTYDERGKPMQRRKLKLAKRAEQNGLCPLCGEALPDIGAVLDRHEAMLGYTTNNTRLLCPDCDRRVQEQRCYT